MSLRPAVFLREAFSLALLVLVALAMATPAAAEKGKLLTRLTPEVMAVVFPGAERLGPEEGTPPAIAAYRDGKIAAYIFSTLDIVAAPGYATTPFDVIAGVDMSGRITGAKVVFHVEPYSYHDAVRQPLLDTYLARQAGTLLQGGAAVLPPDFVKGATISARAMRAAVLDSARLVARARISRPVVTAPTLDVDGFHLMSWNELVAEGAVVRRRITAGEVAAALAAAGRRRRGHPRSSPRQARRSLHRGVHRFADAGRSRRQLDRPAQFRGVSRPAAARRAGHLRRLQRAL